MSRGHSANNFMDTIANQPSEHQGAAVDVGSGPLFGASKRRLLVSRSMGVYLGSCMGMGFWSKLDPVDQPSAVTFDNVETIRNIMAEWDGLGSLPSDMTFPEVEDADGDGYATEAECVTAGVEPWLSPNAAHQPRRGE